MRRVILISLVLANLGCYGGDSTLWKNDKILESAKSKIGTKVERGWCYELVNTCLNEAGVDWIINPKDSTQALIYGKRIRSKKNLKPGDIVYYYWDESKERFSHCAIIYSISARRRIFVVEQNARETLEESKVVIGELPEADSEVKFHLYFIRPY